MVDYLRTFFTVKMNGLKSVIWGADQQINDESSPALSEQAASAAMARSRSEHAIGIKRIKCNKEGKVGSKFNKSLAGRTEKLTDSVYVADGVRFRYPSLDPESMLSKSEWYSRIKDYFNEELEDEKGLAAALIIRNCNDDTGKINACVETLRKYLQNIINQPTEEKFKRIRIQNRTFQEKVVGIEGAIQFLEAVGFVKKELMVHDHLEGFLVYPFDRVEDVQYWSTLMEALTRNKSIELELARNAQVLCPAQAQKQIQLPDDFFRYTSEEVKREYFLQRENLDNLFTLQTNASRDKQKQKRLSRLRKYKYALLHVRFPDGVFLQGTFSVNEKFDEVVKFVENNLVAPCRFSLCFPNGGRNFGPEEYNKTLLELDLVPATVLIFCTKQSNNHLMKSFLKPDLMDLKQKLS